MDHRAEAERLLAAPLEGEPAHVVQNVLQRAIAHALLARETPAYGRLLRLWEHDQREAEDWAERCVSLERELARKRHEHPNWNCDDPDCPY